MSPRRADANQAEIVAALRAFGADWVDLHEVGRGVPDGLVGFRRWLILAEIKGPGGKLNQRQQRWLAEHPDVPVLIFTDPEQACQAVLWAWQDRRTREASL